MNREIKFRGFSEERNEWLYGFYVKDPKGKHRIYFRPFEESTSNTYYFVTPESVGQFTGLKDKNGVEGYFDIDIWEVKNYKYSVKVGGGFRNMYTDLRFILKWHPLEIEYELINPPKDLKHITLSVIFNLSGIFIKDYCENLEIIGNVHLNKELLK